MILLVEDHQDSCEAMRRLLERHGYKAACVSDGQAAIDLLRSVAPGLVFLDWELPGVSGLDVLRMIRSTPHLRDVPVIMFSGYPRNQNNEFDRLGIQGWILKGSFSWEQIQQYVQRCVPRSSQSPADGE